MHKLAVLIVTYNPEIHILSKLINILNQYDKPIEIHLIDNASKNAQELKNIFLEQDDFLFLPENVGLAEAQNIGIEAILKSDAKSVIFFDQDSEPSYEFINELCSACEKLDQSGVRVGGVGPVFFDPRTNTNYPFSVISGLRLKSVMPEGEEPFEVSYLINSGMLVPVETLRQVGSMCGKLFIDYVDIEWCLRAASKGYRFYAIPAAKMSHTIGDDRKTFMGREISIHSPLRRYYLARNSVYMMRLPYVPLGYKLRECIFSIIRVVVFVSCVDKKSTYIKYILSGWRDGLLGRFGKYKG